MRAVPYKLNIYGPGGHFSAHKDTPAADLVGSALIGLGDTSDEQAGLLLETKPELWRADAGSWIMFYPDVVHEVKKVTSGYRATLAFKMVYTKEAHEEDKNTKWYKERFGVSIT